MEASTIWNCSYKGQLKIVISATQAFTQDLQDPNQSNSIKLGGNKQFANPKTSDHHLSLLLKHLKIID